MKFEPHTYQRRAIAHLLLNPASVLLLSMGLGKTVVTLTALTSLLANQLTHKALVIAPKRVALTTWPQELAKWDHLTGLDAVNIVGTPGQRATLTESDTPIHIINRELVPWLVTHHGRDGWPYDTVIIDELSSFKNASSKRNRALHRVRPHIHRIIGLTGTPTSTGLIDLFGQYKLIDPEIFGTRITTYRETYFTPTKYAYGRPVDWALRAGAEQKIYDAIRPVTISMTAEDHLDMPDIIHTDHAVPLSDRARDTYDTLKQDLVTDLDGQTIDALNAATLANKLLQLASGAIYTNGQEWQEVHDGKLDALEDLIEAANGQPLLVAYWFKHDRERILDRFPQARVLDKEQDFTDWNAGKIPVGLIHPASAGHGLNLQAGGHLIVWFALTWSLELYQQLNGRLHRQGQTHPVTVTHIVTAGTIDRRVLSSLAGKDTSQAALIGAVKAELANKEKKHEHDRLQRSLD